VLGGLVVVIRMIGTFDFELESTIRTSLAAAAAKPGGRARSLKVARLAFGLRRGHVFLF
jgi:hypothetical protein